MWMVICRCGMRWIYLLDTNIISEIRQMRPEPSVLQLFMERKNYSVISSITWAESLNGLKRLPEGRKKEALSSYYYEIIKEQFQILGFDGSAAEVYSSLYPKLEGLGRVPQEFDLQIASIAIANNLILVTRNTKDFESICQVSSLMLENWFPSSGIHAL